MNTSDAQGIRSGRVRRVAPLVGLAGRTAGEAVVESLRRRRSGGDSSEFHQRTAERYAEQLGHSKGVLMKAGQILSFSAVSDAGETQPLFQRALQRLQDDAPPMPKETAIRVIETELDNSIDTLFADFDPVPLAAASIGQVHAATLHNGRRVAVKVQYPGVDKAIRADLENVELLATFLRIANGLWPGGIPADIKGLSAELSARIGEEIDYRAEAANQTRFADLYRGHPFIRVPEIVPALSTGRVLTMDLATGMRFSDAASSGAQLKNAWSEAIFRFFYGGFSRLGMLHSDPHPGNYLFHDDGSVTFLDFGCVKQFTPAQSDITRRFVNATVDGDTPGLLAVLNDMGGFRANEPPPTEDLLAWARGPIEYLTGPQPYQVTRNYAVWATRDWASLVGPFANVYQRLTLDPAYIMVIRILVGTNAISSLFEAVGPWEAIRSEWDRGGPPATPLGELEAAFWRAAV
jgi:predicted unusual protein kinase regulating ubiquinone biosynthesis (AarF/ABC1/UbiB family)